MQRWSNLLKHYTFSQSRQLFKPFYSKALSYSYQFNFASVISPTLTQNLQTVPFSLQSTASSNDLSADVFKKAKLFLDSSSKGEISDFQDILRSLTPFQDSSSLSRKQHITMIKVLSQLAKAHHDQLDTTEAFKYYLNASSYAEKAGIKDIIELGYINNGLGAVYLAQDNLAEAEKCLNEAHRILSTMSRFSEPVYPVVQNLCTMAILCHKRGELEEASELFNKVLKRAKEIIEPRISASLTMIAYDGLGYIHYKKTDSLKALECWRAGLQMAITTFGEDALEVKSLYEKLAWVFFDQGKLTQALSYAERSLNIGVKHYGENHHEMSSTLSLIGQIYSGQQEYGKALETYEKVLSLLEMNAQECQDQICNTHLLVATVYFEQGNQKAAEKAFSKAKTTALNTYGEKSAQIAECYFIWANLLKTKQETMNTAKNFYNKALEIYETIDNNHVLKIVDIYSYLGEIAYYQEEVAYSLQLFNESLKRALLAAQQPTRLEEIYSFLGAIHLRSQSLNESIDCYEKAVKTCKALGNSTKKLDFHYRNLGVSYERSGRLEEARDMFKKAVDVGMKTNGKDDEMTQKSVQLLLNVLLKLNKKGDAGKLQRLYVTRPKWY